MEGKPFVFTSRGEIYIKGLKEKQRTYFVEKAEKYTVIEPIESEIAEEPQQNQQVEVVGLGMPLKRTHTDSFVCLPGSKSPQGSFRLDKRQSKLSYESVQASSKKISVDSNNSVSTTQVPVVTITEVDDIEITDTEDNGIIISVDARSDEEPTAAPELQDVTSNSNLNQVFPICDDNRIPSSRRRTRRPRCIIS